MKVTGEEKVSYVGYSLGCAIFYVGANLRPDLNDKIEVMIGLAPTSTVQVLNNAFKLIAPLSNPLKVIPDTVSFHFFFLNFMKTRMKCAIVVKVSDNRCKISRCVYELIFLPKIINRRFGIAIPQPGKPFTHDCT